jgi:hypothetical protein
MDMNDFSVQNRGKVVYGDEAIVSKYRMLTEFRHDRPKILSFPC